ncbi:hypothetical protein D3C81_752510 [compost metagenome]
MPRLNIDGRQSSGNYPNTTRRILQIEACRFCTENLVACSGNSLNCDTVPDIERQPVVVRCQQAGQRGYSARRWCFINTGIGALPVRSGGEGRVNYLSACRVSKAQSERAVGTGCYLARLNQTAVIHGKHTYRRGLRNCTRRTRDDGIAAGMSQRQLVPCR